MVHLVVGYGEVGKSLGKVLGKHMFFTHSKTNWDYSHVDVIHICIPYSDTFVADVKKWKKKGDLVIVHSSVPVGTCAKLGVVHSPIRGVHPHLEKGIRTFTKYFGGKNANKAARIFSRLGLKTKIYANADITEALKLWDTTQYGRMIMLEKEIYQWCEENTLPFSAIYTEGNRSYNEGYTKLGMAHVVRPVLKHMPGEIGGHCVLPNAKLLKVKL